MLFRSIKQYLGSGERVEMANLALPRKFWPELLKGTYPRPLPETQPYLELHIRTENPVEPYSPIPLTWTLLGERIGANCTLFGQKNETELMVEIGKFQAQASQGQMKLDASFRKGALIMICEDPRGLLISKLWKINL